MIDLQTISTALKLGDNGLWCSAENSYTFYPSDGNEACFNVEDSSFWFKHRNNCIASIINAFPPADRGTIFDVGGGNGFVSLRLENEGFDVVLVEPGKTGALNAKKRGLNQVVCATIETAKFKPDSIPAVGLFDVIEHIEYDLPFLEKIKTIMQKDGRLYATVPSYSFLWSAEDIMAGHFRRYTLSEISAVLKAAGFNIEFSSYIFKLLPVPIYLLRALPFKIGLSKPKAIQENISRDHAVKDGFTAKILNSILQTEIDNLNKRKTMRFGGSCLIVATKA